jgi:hypothetical protein
MYTSLCAADEEVELTCDDWRQAPEASIDKIDDLFESTSVNIAKGWYQSCIVYNSPDHLTFVQPEYVQSSLLLPIKPVAVYSWLWLMS